MPIKATAYVFSTDDFLVIEGHTILSKNIESYAIHYDPKGKHIYSFLYTFEISFHGEDISIFKEIRKGLERKENITWHGLGDGKVIILSIDDAMVKFSDDEMEKYKTQTLKVIGSSLWDEIID